MDMSTPIHPVAPPLLRGAVITENMEKEKKGKNIGNFKADGRLFHIFGPNNSLSRSTLEVRMHSCPEVLCEMEILI